MMEQDDGTRQHTTTSSAWRAHVPLWAQPYLRLMRVDKPAGTWLLLLPCWWGLALASDSLPSAWFLFLFAVGAMVLRAAGCIVNDLYDRKLDRLVARTRDRPLASGEISVWQALLLLAALLLLGLVVLLQFNPTTVWLGASSLALVFTYPLMKRATWWPQLFLGFTFNWGVLMGGAAVLETVSWAHLAMYVAGIFWTLAYDTLYAHQDKKDDVFVGIKSTALLFGEASLRWIALFYALTIVFLFWAGRLVPPDGLSPVYGWGLVVAACFAAYQLMIWKPDDPENCGRRFAANRDFGFIVLAAIVLGKLL
ncbi:MAG: 4-hydroxybenzoate octaprenyltransferase [Alphaproteobacteria bacterium]|nr:4-hydroxybenzoate octaprenyltransferase [Alphaproteobacteria bacterium]